jgi:hypothetical protein
MWFSPEYTTRCWEWPGRAEKQPKKLLQNKGKAGTIHCGTELRASDYFEEVFFHGS